LVLGVFVTKRADSRTSTGSLWRAVAFILAAAPVLAACQRETEQAAPEIRPVRTVIAARENSGETVVLTGQVQPRNEASMAFRIGGRMIARPVNVGDRVEAGQVLATLDPVNELNALRSAQAALAAAQGLVTQTRNAFDRQEHLLRNGFTTRANYDQAQQARNTAQAQLDDAEAQLEIAHDRVAFTELKADVSGTITARGAEPGEVVQAGQMIVQLAHEGGRDAVFDVPAQVLRNAPTDPLITVRLTDDPSVSAVGRVREIAPQADAQTRNFPVRVGLDNPPEALRLGSTVSGTMMMDTAPVIAIPATALTTSEQNPAVWIVDPTASTVSLRNVDIVRHDPATVVVSQGLDTGEIVVTAGVQALHPGQKVRLLGSTK
jgi:RND family efflux transporter MFP subunit